MRTYGKTALVFNWLDSTDDEYKRIYKKAYATHEAKIRTESKIDADFFR